MRLHTEDGLSVAVPRSLLVADSLLMREVVATCAACPGESHVTVAGVAGSTLALYKELLFRGQARVPGRSVSGVTADWADADLRGLLRALASKHLHHTQLQEGGGQKRGQEAGKEQRQENLSRLRNTALPWLDTFHNHNRVGSSQSERRLTSIQNPREKLSVSPTLTSTPKQSNLRNVANSDNEDDALVKEFDTNFGPASNNNATTSYLSTMKRSARSRAVMRITKDVATMKNHKIGDDDINLNKRHSGEVKHAFICPICSKSFKRHQDQKKHITVMHPEPNIIKRSFTCSKCSAAFKTKQGRMKHFKTCVFSSADNLKNHVPVNTKTLKKTRSVDHYYCESCPGTMFTFEEERSHRQMTGHKTVRVKLPGNLST